MSRLSPFVTSHVRPLFPNKRRYTLSVTCDTPPLTQSIDAVIDDAFEDVESVLTKNRVIWGYVSAQVDDTRDELRRQVRPYLATVLKDVSSTGDVGRVSVAQTYDNYFDVPYEENTAFATVAEETFDFIRQYSNFDTLDMSTVRRKVVEHATGDPNDVTEYGESDDLNRGANIYAFQSPSWKPGLRGHHGVHLPASLRRRLREATGDGFRKDVHRAAMRTTVRVHVVLPATARSDAAAHELVEQLAADMTNTQLVSKVHEANVIGADGVRGEEHPRAQMEDARDQLSLVAEAE